MMDSQQVETPDAQEQQLPSSAELRARLAPHQRSTEVRTPTRAKQEPTKKRISLSAPAWTLLGALTLFTCAILAKANKPVKHVLAPGEASTLVDARLFPAPPNPAAQANLERAVRDYKALNDDLVNKVLSSLNLSPAPVSSSQQRDLQNLLAQPKLARLVDDLSLPVYETPPQKGTGPRFPYPRLARVARLYADHKLEIGETQEAMRAYKTLLSLYPRMEASHGGAAWVLAYSAASESVTCARNLWQDRSLSDNQLQSLLREMKPPTSVAAEEDAVRYAVSHDLVNQLSDPNLVQPLLASYRIAGPVGLDPQATFRMANRAALATLQNLRLPWSQQDRTEAGWLQMETEEARQFGEQAHPSTDWLANLAQRRRANASKNMIGMAALTSWQFILTGQPETMFGARTSYEAARTILGMAVYQRRYGRGVHSLHELVDAGIFKDLPQDPYTGQPFFFDRMRESIWSVGQDGINNGGGNHGRPVPGGQSDQIYYLNGK